MFGAQSRQRKRRVFFLFVLPGLLAVRRVNSDRMLRGVLSLTLAAVPILMWEEGIRHGFEPLLRAIGLPDRIPGLPSELFWLLRELTFWLVISVLTALIVVWAVQTPSLLEMKAAFGRRNASVVLGWNLTRRAPIPPPAARRARSAGTAPR